MKTDGLNGRLLSGGHWPQSLQTVPTSIFFYNRVVTSDDPSISFLEDIFVTFKVQLYIPVIFHYVVISNEAIPSPDED
jgi:hypothetical protein